MYRDRGSALSKCFSLLTFFLAPCDDLNNIIGYPPALKVRRIEPPAAASVRQAVHQECHDEQLPSVPASRPLGINAELKRASGSVVQAVDDMRKELLASIKSIMNCKSSKMELDGPTQAPIGSAQME